MATLSKSFQKGTINYASIKPSIDYSKDRLNDVKITEEPIKQLKQDQFLAANEIKDAKKQ